MLMLARVPRDCDLRAIAAYLRCAMHAAGALQPEVVIRICGDHAMIEAHDHGPELPA
jgi:hypothetical protein